jgi:hypothetical protein
MLRQPYAMPPSLWIQVRCLGTGNSRVTKACEKGLIVVERKE